MSNVSFRKALRFAVCVCATVTASVGYAQIDPTKSLLTATLTQMNVPVEGRFKQFNADIAFDPAKPAAASVRMDVDVDSYDLGDESFNSEARDSDWFDAARYPEATFRSSGVTALGGNLYAVAGALTIKGKTVDVAVPVLVSRQSGRRVFDGTLPIKRSQFGVGVGEWKDTSVVADSITIKFHVVDVAK